MGILDKTLSRIGYIKANNARRLLAPIAGNNNGYPVTDPDPSIYKNQADLMKRLSWIYTAVSITSQTAASLANFQVFTYTNEKKTPIVNHEFEQRLRNPNPYQFDSKFEFFEALFGYTKLAGNCYLWLNAISPNIPPAEIWLLRPDRVTIIPSAETLVAGYVYEVDGAKTTFNADEIIHIKQFHPTNDWYGLSAIEALSLASESDYKQQVWNKNFFGKDNAKPQGAIAFSDMVGETDWEIIKKDIKAEFGGSERRTMLIRGAGKGGIDWKQMAFTQKEMEFLAGRQFNKEEIFMTLAPGLVSILDKNTTEANSSAGEKTFREYCIYPMHMRVQEKFTAKVLPRYGDGLIGEFEEIRVRDRVLELQEREAYERTHTIDEVREKFDGDKSIGDERGKLLVVEVAPAVRSDPSLVQGMGGTPMPETAKPIDTTSTPDTTATDVADQVTKSANTNGVMIALALPTSAANTLADFAQEVFGEDAVTADQMHVTLSYIGDVDALTVSPETLVALIRVFAQEHGLVHGIIGGIVRFNKADAEGRSAICATFDSPDLPKLYQDLVEMMDAGGVQIDKTHGFIPHITLAYTADEATVLNVPPLQISFDGVTLAMGGQWQTFPFGAKSATKGINNGHVSTESERGKGFDSTRGQGGQTGEGIRRSYVTETGGIVTDGDALATAKAIERRAYLKWKQNRKGKTSATFQFVYLSDTEQKALTEKKT